MQFWHRYRGGQEALPWLYQHTLVLMRVCVVHLRNEERDPVPNMNNICVGNWPTKEGKRKIYLFNIASFFELSLYQYAHFRMFLPSVECRTSGEA